MDNDGKTPSYIKSLVMPSAKKAQARRVWSIDLLTVWLPFFAATNTLGDTAIPADALGCPIRLGYNKDGSVKFGNTGRPVTRVAKELSQSVAMVRDNFTANLMDFAQAVAKQHKDAFNKTIQTAHVAGLPIAQHDKVELDRAVQLQIEQALKEAEAQAKAPAEAPAEAPKSKEAVTA